MATPYLKWMETRASNLVAQDWRLVCAFADRLLDAGTLHFDEIGDVVAATLNAQYNPR
jgi:hypothetical protein